MPSPIPITSLGLVGLAFLGTVFAGPCDLYAAGGTACIAAHSTTRALYSSFTGILYQIERASDSKTTTVTTLDAGGIANVTIQDTFCARTTCTITIIYDQSGRGNHLTVAPPGGAANGTGPNHHDQPANAALAPITLSGRKAYGVYIAPGVGYRNDHVNGSATGDQAQGIYAIFDGTHYNDQCCFDYGNAETNNLDTGNGHMEAIYFGNCKYWGTGDKNGPWILADLENGLFSGQNLGKNTAVPSLTSRFVTAIVKGKPATWAIRGGDSASGTLSTYYNGARPTTAGYNPMHKEGAILLGIGGDNSNNAQGTFYEGAMTYGYPSDAVENSVQANIVAAKYAV